MMATPDELQADIYRDHIHNNLRDGAAIAFAHGLNVHCGLIEPKKTVRCRDDRAEGSRPHGSR